MTNKVYSRIYKNFEERVKSFAVLVDPDKTNNEKLEKILRISTDVKIDYFFIGGSLLINDQLENCIAFLKQNSHIPVVLFPGNNLQISNKADALLLLSLISGRNPDFLIGQHVIAAPALKKSDLEIIPTGYMLIESNNTTSASYISNTIPIPHDKKDIAACTAMAGEMLGMKLIYMDGGSGAKKPISSGMIREVKKNISIPLIIGGGIVSAEMAKNSCEAGADIIVVGNAIEKAPSLISEIAQTVKESVSASS